MSVSFAECEVSPIETYDKGEFWAVRVFLVAWEDRHDFCRYLLGVQTKPPTPVCYPGFPSCVAVKAECKPWNSIPGLYRACSGWDAFSDEYRGERVEVTVLYEEEKPPKEQAP